MYTQKRISEFLKAANRDLGDGKYTGDQMIPDYCMAVNIGKQLQAQLLDLRGANEKTEEVNITEEVVKELKKISGYFETDEDGFYKDTLSVIQQFQTQVLDLRGENEKLKILQRSYCECAVKNSEIREKYRKALLKYGCHEQNCRPRPDKNDCKCGWVKVLLEITIGEK